MDQKETSDGQEQAPDSKQPQPAVATPVLSGLNDIQDVENEKPPVPPLTFNTVADGVPIREVSTKWRYLFIVLAVLQLIAIGLVLQTMSTAEQTAASTGSNAEIIVLYAYLMFVLPAALMAVVNLITLPIYLVKARPQRNELILCGVSLGLSVAVVVFAILAFNS